MEPTPFNKLKLNTNYYIVSYEIIIVRYNGLITNKRLSEGIFVGYTYRAYNQAIMKNSKSNFKKNLPRIEMETDDDYYSYALQDYIYYDADLIDLIKKNAKMAKQNRENRTITLVLQSIIGDNYFVW
jgi:hypothetical protein